MENNNEKKVIIDVIIKNENAIKELVELRVRATSLRREMKGLDKDTEEGRIAYERYNIELKATNASIRELERSILLNEKAVNSAEGSYNKLSAQHRINQAQIYAMGEATEAEIASKRTLEVENEKIYQQMVKLQAATGPQTLSVGNYAKAWDGLGNATGQLARELPSLAVSANTFFLAISNNVPILADEINRLKVANAAARAEGLATIPVWKQVVKSFLGWNTAMSIGITILTVYGKDVVDWIANLFKSKEAIDANKKAQEEFNKAMLEGRKSAQADITRLNILYNATQDNTRGLKERKSAVDALQKEFPDYFNNISDENILAGKGADAYLRLSKAIIESAKARASHDKIVEYQKQYLDIENQITEKRVQLTKAEADLELSRARASRGAQTNVGAFGGGSIDLGLVSRTNEVNSLTNEISELYKELDSIDEISNRLASNINIEDLLFDSGGGNDGEKGKNEELKRQEDRIKSHRDLAITVLKLDDDYNSEDIKKRLAHQEKVFKIQADSAKTILNLRKSFGDISQEEYNAESRALEVSQKEFRDKQTKELNSYLNDQRGKILSLLEKSADDQIKEVEKKYEKAVKSLGEIQVPIRMNESDEEWEKTEKEYNKLILDRVNLESALEKSKQKEIDKINENSTSKRVAEIEKAIKDQYKNDLAEFSDNELAKLRIEEAALRETIKKKREVNLETYDDEAKLRQIQSTQNLLQLNLDLSQCDLSAKKRYDLTKEALEKEAKLYEGNEVKLAEINQKIQENEQEYLNERLEAFQEYTDAVIELMNGINELANALGQSELQEAEDRNEKEKESLQNKLDRGIISQKEYDREIANLDKQLDKEKAEIARKQAIREKALSVFQIGLNTAAAIMKIWADVPKGDFGASTIALTAIASALGALQLATVIATPLPKAAKGMKIEGASHANGGVLIEAEGGEMIINKKSASLFGPLLSAINEAGGGDALANIPNGNYGFRNLYGGQSELDGFKKIMDLNRHQSQKEHKRNMQEFANAVSNAVQQLRVITTIEDIRRGDENYSNVENELKS